MQLTFNKSEVIMKDLKEKLSYSIQATTGANISNASPRDYWTALSKNVVAELAEDWSKTKETYAKARQQFYMSAEFLVGRALLNNLINLGRFEEAKEVLASMGQDINEILEQEEDPGLGNGGLGRLAACFMDSCATLNLPVTGYGILYRFGLFYQYFNDGFQDEKPNAWMEQHYPFVVRRGEDEVKVSFSDMTVRAIPFDMPITGYGTKNVNTLRLWQAKSIEDFDFHLFNDQHFGQALSERNRIEDIWRVLYPNDNGPDGKCLRLRQQYFFVSASLQDMIRSYKKNFGEDLSDLAKWNSVQLNDTHPVIAIPELMRLLIDEHGMSWEKAFDITKNVFAYTNHTILSEALEKWDVGLVSFLLPRIYEIIQGIDAQFRQEMAARGLYPDKIEYLAPISNNKVHMAWLACYTGYSINGVAALHTEILKEETLRDWYELYPERFSNKTNGVTPRRWLRMCNPELSAVITKALGSESWVRHLEQLENLLDKADDKQLQEDFLRVKKEKKVQLVEFLKKYEGIEVSPDAIFDVQIKRLHEYKRQLLNVLYIIDLYYRLKENPELFKTPRVFIFGAKAAPGYYRAKSIIKLINEVGRIVNNDESIQGKIKVIFVHNYSVSIAEKLFPASDISEQISTAGLEASGTGNMKFMMNGALTLGTLDGANVEIIEAVGDENGYIFGAKVEELREIKRDYNPHYYYETVPGLRRVLDSLIDGSLNDNHTGRFLELYENLVRGSGWEKPDNYYLLGDFASYRETRDRMAADYENRSEWAKKCIINIAKSGRFSSDRTIQDYVNDIWKIETLKI